MAVNFDTSSEKEAGLLRFLKSQLFFTPPLITREEVDLAGKTAVVTGANVGLGLECARQLLDLGCKVILAVRSESRGEAARQQLAQGRDAQSTDIEVLKLDLNSYDSVVSFAERTKTLTRLDIAVLNAGIYKVDESFNSATGYEEDIQVNYLSNALLALLLVPIMTEKKTGDVPGRIVLVSSGIANATKFSEKGSNPILPTFRKKMEPKWLFKERHGTSKVLVQMFVAELAKRVPSSAVVVTVANPGFCHGSEIIRDGEGRFVGYLYKVIMATVGRPCSVGARVYVHAAVSPTLGETVHGQHVEDATLRPMAPLIYKPEGKQAASKLWEEIMDEFSFVGVRQIIDGLSKSA
ncbi:NAD(P)-binding protein [Daldinia vernicosa]|uniref:NAD(P)-binding protein n=1 Tax=Daldinia vernicosa TaxID=114800 RepID=UPI0020072578|nr:NAD(P)-binding protein [Daldinia vernicosa]KAI0849494.1 NAD(P)-binding protein [Daldinia vernicosa]